MSLYGLLCLGLGIAHTYLAVSMLSEFTDSIFTVRETHTPSNPVQHRSGDHLQFGRREFPGGVLALVCGEDGQECVFFDVTDLHGEDPPWFPGGGERPKRPDGRKVLLRPRRRASSVDRLDSRMQGVLARERQAADGHCGRDHVQED